MWVPPSLNNPKMLQFVCKLQQKSVICIMYNIYHKLFCKKYSVMSCSTCMFIIELGNPDNICKQLLCLYMYVYIQCIFVFTFLFLVSTFSRGKPFFIRKYLYTVIPANLLITKSPSMSSVGFHMTAVQSHTIQ